MLEDFAPKDDKPNIPRGGDVIQPNTNQQPPQANNTPPAGPYRPSILNQNNTEPSGIQKPEETKTPDVEQPETQNANAPDQSTSNKPPQLMAKNSNKKLKKILLTLITVVLIGGLGFAGWWFGIRDTGVKSVTKSENSTPNVNETESKKLVPATLSGLEVDTEIANRPVTGIMIENSGESRPQSGLIEADVVFEAIAEGGITRFLALYQSKKPEYIGPVRSARPYYVEWAKTFDASYVHAGGSPDGLQAITSLGVKDISAFAYGGDTFYRTTDRQSPHNLYSSFKGLDKVNQEKGFTSSKFTPWGRKKDVPQTPTAKNISISISSDFYNPSYTYDAATNSYLRSQGGEIHKDEKSGKQLSPKTVLVLIKNKTQNGIYSVYKTTGTGKFYAFQDGLVTEGTWSKNSATEQYTFKDSNGFDYLFNRGQTWVSIASDANGVSYKP